MENANLKVLEIGDYRISVAYQDNYQEKTLVFLHGNSLSMKIWEKQFSGMLYEHYNLLAFDLPGHGNSAWARRPEETYTLPGYATVLGQLLDRLEIKNYILVGHSLGGHVVLEFLPRCLNCEAAIVISAPPLSKPLDLSFAFLPNPYAQYLFAPEATDSALKGLVRAMVAPGYAQPPAFLKEDYLLTDPLARIHLIKSGHLGQYEDEVEVLSNTSVPVTLMLGEEDQMISLSYLLQMPMKSDLHRVASHRVAPHRVVTVPKAGHIAPYENAAYFNQFLVRRLFLQPTIS